MLNQILFIQIIDAETEERSEAIEEVYEWLNEEETFPVEEEPVPSGISIEVKKELIESIDKFVKAESVESVEFSSENAPFEDKKGGQFTKRFRRPSTECSQMPSIKEENKENIKNEP